MGVCVGGKYKNARIRSSLSWTGQYLRLDSVTQLWLPVISESAGWQRKHILAHFLQKTRLVFNQKLNSRILCDGFWSLCSYWDGRQNNTHTHTLKQTCPCSRTIRFSAFFAEIPAKAQQKVRGASSSSETTKLVSEKTKGDMLSPKLPPSDIFTQRQRKANEEKTGGGDLIFMRQMTRRSVMLLKQTRKQDQRGQSVCARPRVCLPGAVIWMGWSSAHAKSTCKLFLHFVFLARV